MKTLKKGFTLVELLVVIGILGILMGALYPQISSAMLKAKTSAMSMSGKNLFSAMLSANITREQVGRGTVWPQDDTDGLDDDDKQLIGASTCTEYFRYLFDVDNKGNSANHRPVVNCDISVISGYGVPGVSGTSITKKNVAWMICKNVQDSMSDIIPVLVSRNVQYSALNSALAGKVEGSESTEIKCGNGTGADDVPFGDKAWILVRKGGSAEVIESRYSLYSDVFKRTGFDNSNLDEKPEFMEL